MQETTRKSSARLNQRRLPDRRSRPSLFNYLRWVFRGRRRTLRRRKEQTGRYLDWHEPILLYVALATFIFSGLDAAFTLNLLQKGALEVNPLMALLIEKDTHLFVITKLMVTFICLVLLVAHSNFALFKKIKIEPIVYGLFGIYLTLIGYEFFLLRS